MSWLQLFYITLLQFNFKNVGFRRNVLKLDVLALEILSIALPAALALLADPITSLVDTAFVGHLGNFLSTFLSDFSSRASSNI